VAARAPVISLAGRAYLRIRDQILKGDLAVGTVLSRRKLAQALKISVPPVTEALLQLESEGLIESKPRVGTRVRIPTRADVEDRCVVREALESQAARLFSVRSTPAERSELRRMGRQVDKLYACSEGDPGDRNLLFSANTYHMALHLRIAECARSPALRDAIEKEQVLVFSWLFDTAAQRHTLGSNYHAQLTAALAKGSLTQADAAIRHHIRRGLKEVLAGLERLQAGEGGWRRKRRQRGASK